MPVSRDPFSPPFVALAAGLVALGAGPIAALVPLGMAPVLITLAVVAGGLALIRRRALPPLDGRMLLAFGLFWAYGALSLAWTPVRKDGAAQVVTFAYEFGPGLLLLALAPLLPEPARRGIVAWGLVGVAIGLGLLAVEVLAGQPIYHLAKSIEGLAAAADRALNRPAVILAMLVWPASAALIGMGRIWPAALLPPAYLALTMLTPSASAVAGMAVGLLLLMLAARAPRVARRLLGALLVLGFLASVPVAHGLMAVGLSGWEDLPFSFRHRVAIWDVTAALIAERPLFGWGLDSSRALAEVSPALAGPLAGFDALPLHPHNLFLQSLLELGVVGSALLLVLLLLILDRTRSLAPVAERHAIAAYGCGLVIACFAYGAWQTWWLCTLLFAAFLLLLAAPAGRVSAAGSGSPDPLP